MKTVKFLEYTQYTVLFCCESQIKKCVCSLTFNYESHKKFHVYSCLILKQGNCSLSKNKSNNQILHYKNILSLTTDTIIHPHGQHILNVHFINVQHRTMFIIIFKNRHSAKVDYTAIYHSNQIQQQQVLLQMEPLIRHSRRLQCNNNSYFVWHRAQLLQLQDQVPQKHFFYHL